MKLDGRTFSILLLVVLGAVYFFMNVKKSGFSGKKPNDKEREMLIWLRTGQNAKTFKWFNDLSLDEQRTILIKFHGNWEVLDNRTKFLFSAIKHRYKL
jgi:hypothetical protein